ncbi:acyloxyacyl hydrolase [Sinorhizobium mexicanum]|uniref:Acyloxyacyl hydrolase n=1 Tax=Sinorhizobium mexicanum TaxID=375549 RepID=A0A859QN91_9HYPH|nr:acyloxyacyl hydrolase [Sinorhizobium mexicanum]MBP1886598.1 hypothetical protein [Sinorhizobium mexicanum]QLL64180.1 acyloxyacyl hydrolase [Sinorhizobium mexicanum]
MIHRRSPVAALVTLTWLVASAAPAVSGETVFDEMRFGATTSIGDGENRESGGFPSATVFFDPFGAESATSLVEKVLRPRIHAGASIATTSSGVDQVYGGFSWSVDLTQRLFVELGIGGTVHDGNLSDGDDSDGPKLGCRLLFREYAAAGYRFDDHWNLSATIEHSSNANLCDGPNDGLTRGGLTLGYRF